MKTRARSLSRRLILVAMVWIGLSLTASGVVLSFIFEQTVREAFEENLTAQLRAVMASLGSDNEGRLGVVVPLDDARYRQVQSGWYWQISGPDNFLLRSRSLWDEALPPIPDAKPGVISFSDLKGPRDQTLRAASTIMNRPEVQGLLIVAAVDTATLDAQVQRFNRIIFAALGTLGLGLAVAVILQVLIGLRPLRRLKNELNAIRDGTQDQLMHDQPSEVAPLVEAFNEVRAHDHETLAKARREVGNLAHSLKTPLAQMALKLDGVGADLRDQLMQHVNDLRSKIDFYAARAATAAARGATARRINVQGVINDIVNALRKINADTPKKAHVLVPPEVTVLAEEEDITEILSNLLDNAYKWAHSRINVTAVAGAYDFVTDDYVTVVIEDDGPGVPADKVADIFKGQRLDEKVPGTGLGLQVVRDIVRAYDGTLTLERSELGGLRAAVKLPSRRESQLKGKLN